MKSSVIAGLLSLSLLASCGGGGGGDDVGTGTASSPSSAHSSDLAPVSPTAGSQPLNIPALAGRKARLQLVDLPEQDFPEVEVPTRGQLRLSVPTTLEDRLFRVMLLPADSVLEQNRVRLGAAVDTSAGSKAPQALVLAKGKQLNAGLAGFNPIADYISRRLDAYTSTHSDERIGYFMDGIAREMIRQDLDGDGQVTFADAALFDPANAQHLGALSFNYAERVTSPLSAGRTLLATYTEAPDQTANALNEAFEPAEGYDLPGPDVSIVTVLHADVDKGGSMTVDQLPGIRLQADNSRLLQRDLRSATPATYRLRAVPDAGWRFVRWVGCEDVGADGSCAVRMDDDKRVGAQFGLDRNVLAPGVAGVLRLSDFPAQAFTLTMPSPGIVDFTGLPQGPLLGALTGIGTGHVIATGDREHPLLQITQPPSGRSTGADGLSSLRFAVADVSYLDVYQALSTFDDDRPVDIEDVVTAKLTLADEATAVPAPGLAKSAAAEEKKPVWVMGLGRAVDVGHGHLLVRDPAGKGLALVKAADRAVLQEVPAAKALRKLVDRCVQNAGAPECVLVGGPAQAKSMQKAGATGCAILVGGCNITVLEVRLTRQQPGKQPSKNSGQFAGIFKVEANLDMTYNSSTNLMWSLVPPGLDLAYNGRGMMTLTAGAGLFIGLDGKFDAKKSIDLYERKGGKDTGKKASVDVSGDLQNAEQNQSGRAAAPKLDQAAAAAASMEQAANAGAREAVPAAGAGPAAAAPVAVGPPGPPPAAAQAAQEPLAAVRVELAQEARAEEVAVPAANLSIQLNRTTPDGAVAPLKLSFSFGVKGKGKLGLDSSAVMVIRYPFEVDVDVGSKCRKVSYLVTEGTSCEGLKSPQRFETASNLKVYSKLGTKVVANAEAGPYAAIALTWGPAGLKEDLVKIQASAAAMASFVGSAELWSYSNLPEDRAASAGIAAGCTVSLNPLAFSLDAVLEASGKVDASIQRSFFGKQLEIKMFEMDIFKYTYKIPIIKPQLMFKNLAASTRPDACLPVMKRPASLMPDEIVWSPGELKWDEPNYVVTKNRRLALQLDGNFVLYALTREQGGQGGIASETVKDWPGRVQTNTYPGTTLEFQDDGNLVLYSVRGKPLWASNTAVKKEDAGNMRLVLQKDGNLVIYDGTSARWASNTVER